MSDLERVEAMFWLILVSWGTLGCTGFGIGLEGSGSSRPKPLVCIKSWVFCSGILGIKSVDPEAADPLDDVCGFSVLTGDQIRG